MSQIVVCGQPRNGTSMIMRMLQMGGIQVERSSERDTPELMAQYRTPYGFFELYPPTSLTTGNFKCIFPKYLENVSTDAKLIRITRDLDEVFASWQTVTGVQTPEMRINRIQIMRQRWNDALAGKTVLSLDYDEVATNPIKAAQQIADFIQVPFDVAGASEAVDKTLYVDRSIKSSSSSESSGNQ